VGVEIAVDVLRVACVSLVGKILWSNEEPLFSQQPDGVCQQTAQLVARAYGLLDSWGLQLTGLGVGLPGAFDETTGKVRFAANLGWWNVDFLPRLNLALANEGLSQVPVFVQNEADTAALSEYEFVEGHVSDSLIFITCDVGVGAGIVLNDRLFTGQHGGAGEIGHCILQVDGPLCSCGRRGCAETFFGARTLDKLVNPLSGGKYLGVVLANLWTTFDPSVLVVGGISSIKYPGLITQAQETLKAYADSARMPAPPVRAARYGLLASAVGAAALVLHRQLRPMHAPTGYAINTPPITPN
jgi:predicted NBD/HSP70 family sugar kinase